MFPTTNSIPSTKRVFDLTVDSSILCVRKPSLFDSECKKVLFQGILQQLEHILIQLR